MLEPKLLDELSRRITDAIPKPLQDLQSNAEAHVRERIEDVINRLDLVTREDFDIQAQVLQRTRAKVEQLERQVAELEARLHAQQPAD